jgi:hypothetical protein
MTLVNATLFCSLRQIIMKQSQKIQKVSALTILFAMKKTRGGLQFLSGLD